MFKTLIFCSILTIALSAHILFFIDARIGSMCAVFGLVTPLDHPPDRP